MTKNNHIFCSLFTKGIFNKNMCDTYFSNDLIKIINLVGKDINFPYLATLLSNIKKEDINILILLSFYIRNPRNGRGCRKTGRYMFQWLTINHPKIFAKYFKKISDYGRWDDLFLLFPGALKLNSINFVNKNYCSKINETKLRAAQSLQKKIVKYIAEKFLYFFNLFMRGKYGFELFAKWLPSEKSSFNKKYKIVETLCDELNLSLKDYRIIYVTPMRKASNICENYMCKSEWNIINYEKLSKNKLSYYKNAFRRHDNKRFNNIQIMRNFFSKPESIINNYFNQILENDRKRENSILELSWQKTLKLILDNTENLNVLVFSDTNGAIYKKYKKYRFISYIISLNIISACRRKFNKNKILFYKNNREFYDYQLTTSLFDTITRFRTIFTDQPSLLEIMNYSYKKPIETILYITFKIPELKVLDIKDKETPNIIIWVITSNIIDYRILTPNIFILEGFSIEIFRYFLINGNYNPNNIISQIINKYSN